jgi:DNA-directed RNA polymerase specialized sigma24 family protein
VCVSEFSLAVSDGGQAMGDIEVRGVVSAALDNLGPADRRLIQMRFYDGATLGQIGAMAGRSRERLRQRIDEVLARVSLAIFDSHGPDWAPHPSHSWIWGRLIRKGRIGVRR